MSTAVAEATRLIKFDGNDAKWAEWSVKALAFAKSKDFKEAFIGNKSVVFTDALFQDIAFGLVNLAKTADIADGVAQMVWKTLPSDTLHKALRIWSTLWVSSITLVLESSTEDPILWVICPETIRSSLSAIGTT